MDIVVIKYMQLFCLTIFFTNNMNCHELLIKNEKDNRQLYYVAACTGLCLQDNRNETLPSCYDHCLSKTYDPLKPLLDIQCEINVELICRTDTSLVLRMIVNNGNMNKTGVMRKKIKRNLSGAQRNYQEMNINQQFNQENDNHNNNNNNGVLDDSEELNYDEDITELCRKSIKLIKVQNPDQIIGETLVYLANTTIITINDLSPNTTYNISATVVTSNEKYIYLLDDIQYETLPYLYKPNPIENFTINYVDNKMNDSFLDAVITWEPTSDMTCWYEVFYHPKMTGEIIKLKRRRKPEDLYFCPIEYLGMGAPYNIAIRSINPNDISKENNLNWTVKITPSCLEWHNNNLDICAPPPPEYLYVDEVSLGNDLYRVNISWIPAYLDPYEYTVNIYDLFNSDPSEPPLQYYDKISGNKSEISFPSIKLFGTRYEVHLNASTTGGYTVIAAEKTLVKYNYSVESLNVRKLIMIVLGPIIFIALVFFVILLICHRRAKIKRYEDRRRYFQELEQQAPVDPNSNFDMKSKEMESITVLTTKLQTDDCFLFNYDKMEVLRDNIKLLDVLGEGAFGLVRKGLLKSELDKTTKYVAVKMLKDHPAIEDIKEFRREIEVMKSVGEHPNIVGIIGHCTRNVNELMLLTVFCSKGNLLNYLRTEWQRISKIGYTETELESTTPLFVLKKAPENAFNFDTSFVDKESLKYKDLNDDGLSIKSQPTSLTTIDDDPTVVTEQSKAIDENTDNQIGTKLYDNLITENKNEELLQCTNSCKCFVEILPNTSNPQMTNYSHLIMNNDNNNNNNTEERLKQKILVQDCFCVRNNERKLLQERSNGESVIEEKPEDLLSVENRGYDKTLSYFDESSLAYNDFSLAFEEQENSNDLTSLDLLNFAKQIASGMTFLSQNKVVHRDLAARNVLVCSDKTIKIADFGLSRDIYQENMYKRTGNGKLPIKWLALESLTHQVYTSQSDVWAYGILLFEIVTLGGNPYPSIPTNRLLKILKNGYRMEKPKNCSTEIYELMRSCWRINPHERPTFNDIGRKLDEYLINSTETEYIQMNTQEENKRNSLITDEAYLKPI